MQALVRNGRGLFRQGAQLASGSQRRSMGNKVVSIATPVRESTVAKSGYDAEYFHPQEEKVATMERWKMIASAGAAICGVYTVYVYFFDEHHHADEMPEYDYLHITRKVPRFPWGNRELIGTPEDRKKWREEDAA